MSANVGGRAYVPPSPEAVCEAVEQIETGLRALAPIVAGFKHGKKATVERWEIARATGPLRNALVTLGEEQQVAEDRAAELVVLLDDPAKLVEAVRGLVEAWNHGDAAGERDAARAVAKAYEAFA